MATFTPPEVREQLAKHREYLKGIDPDTNIGMHRLNRVRQLCSLQGFFGEGQSETVILIHREGFYYAFGHDARLIREVATHVSGRCSSEHDGMGTWEAVPVGEAVAQVAALLAARGLRVHLVSIPSETEPLVKGGAA